LSVATPVPLVIALYGATGTPSAMEGQTRFETVAAEHGFVVVYPGSDTNPPWNSPSDLSYLSSLIAQVEASQNIDPARIYVTGFSAGARMTYDVGCMLSAKLAAIAAVSGLMRGTCTLAHPVSELSIVGSSEPNLISGSPTIPSAATIAAQWHLLDGCPAEQPAVSQVGPVTQQTWLGCANGSAVGLYVVQGGGHYWPGQYGAPGPDAPGQYSASEAIWAFFAAHPAAPAPVPVSSAPPTTKGRAVAGQALTESHGSWTNSPTGYSYQWERCNSAGAGCRALAGATGPTYTLTARDVGSTILVTETASNVWGAGGPSTSRATSVVRPTAPNTKLLKKTVSSSHHSAMFSFKATGHATGFQCALVRTPTPTGTKTPPPKYAKCGSTKSFTHLKAGKYELYVRAVGPGGVDPTPATYRFRIA
jgi:polyhydroxybutyrate depolymerase